MTATTERTKVKASAKTNDNSIGYATITMFGGASMVVGIWAATCFIAALASNGPAAIVKGFITAVTGV